MMVSLLMVCLTLPTNKQPQAQGHPQGVLSMQPGMWWGLWLCTELVKIWIEPYFVPACGLCQGQ